MSDKLFDAPNLDDCSAEDLDTLAYLFNRLRDYAIRARDAKVYRAKGKIDLALEFEKTCQEIYDDLPSWARW